MSRDLSDPGPGLLCVHYGSRYNSRYIALQLAYLGEDYHGFAMQEDSSPTIEVGVSVGVVRILCMYCVYCRAACLKCCSERG